MASVGSEAVEALAITDDFPCRSSGIGCRCRIVDVQPHGRNSTQYPYAPRVSDCCAQNAAVSVLIIAPWFEVAD